jgi:hypothetical protein
MIADHTALVRLEVDGIIAVTGCRGETNDPTVIIDARVYAAADRVCIGGLNQARRLLVMLTWPLVESRSLKSNACPLLPPVPVDMIVPALSTSIV